LDVCRDQLAGERKVELQRLEVQNRQAEANQAAEEERLRREEMRYRMELQVWHSCYVLFEERGKGGGGMGGRGEGERQMRPHQSL